MRWTAALVSALLILNAWRCTPRQWFRFEPFEQVDLPPKRFLALVVRTGRADFYALQATPF